MNEHLYEFRIYKDSAGEYRWRLVAGNGEKVAASEGYTSKQHALRSAEQVRQEGGKADIVDETSQ